MSHNNPEIPAGIDASEGEVDQRRRWRRPELTLADIGPSTQNTIGPISTDGSFAPKAS